MFRLSRKPRRLWWHVPGAVGAPVALAGLLVAMGAGVAVADERNGTRTEIVARAIEYHGGDLYQRSETSLELCSGSGCYQISVRTDGGSYRHLVSGPYKGAIRTVTADNDSVSASRDGEPLVVLDQARQALRDWATARIYFAFLPYRLNDPGVLQEDLGVEEWEGRPLHKVKVTFVAGSSTDAEDEYLYWFEPENGRLEQFAYSFQGKPGGLRFRRLSNYRRVGGLLFFDQSNLGVEGNGLVVDQITATFVGERMGEVSQVELRGIKVRELSVQ